MQHTIHRLGAKGNIYKRNIILFNDFLVTQQRHLLGKSLRNGITRREYCRFFREFPLHICRWWKIKTSTLFPVVSSHSDANINMFYNPHEYTLMWFFSIQRWRPVVGNFDCDFHVATIQFPTFPRIYTVPMPNESAFTCETFHLFSSLFLWHFNLFFFIFFVFAICVFFVCVNSKHVKCWRTVVVSSK